MSEVVLFNHIPKTAGSTLRHVLFRAVGGDRVLFATRIGAHPEAVAAIAARLDRPLDGAYAVVAHTGVGVEARLPARHAYRRFTVLRDPLERTISAYYYIQDRWGSSLDISFDSFLEDYDLHVYNSQTAFLAGLAARHHLDGAPIDRRDFDGALLEEAKRNLAAHDVIGLTERFDQTLLMLRRSFGWQQLRTLYRPANVGSARRRTALSERELEAVAAVNRLDLELYDYGRELFERRLAEQAPDHRAQLRRFQLLNGVYRRTYPLAYPPTRALVRGARRVRGRLPAGA